MNKVLNQFAPRLNQGSKILTLLLTGAVLLSAGCSSLSNSVHKYDRSQVYLQTDRYAAKPIKVPSDLDTGAIDDFYPVPTIADQGDPKVPSLVPPKDDNPVVKKQSKGTIT